MRVPYTGCNPRGLMLARGKDLSKKLVHYHRIPVPAFAVFPMRPQGQASDAARAAADRQEPERGCVLGISQASVVDTDEKLAERVDFIHERIGTAAIAEQYIEGREIYVGVLGNERLRVLPVWELEFGNLAEGAWPIATEKVKHDPDYQERRGILHGPGEGPARRRSHAHPARWRSGSTARSSSTAMPASISACPRTAFPISSRPTPIPRSPRARNSPPPPSTTAFHTTISCSAFSRSA